MRILFVGDIVGRGGRRVLSKRLNALKAQHRIDFTIVNVENSAGGFGLTPRIGRQILELGVDVMTSGNHIWDQRDLLSYLDEEPRLLRPANYPQELAGHGVVTVQSECGQDVCVVNLQGRVFMANIDCPFKKAGQILDTVTPETKIIVCDFHAEATSEKVAMGWFLDGRVSAVLGTHTHIPTGDARILPNGTAYMTDVGMSGSYDSVIGMNKEVALHRLVTGLPARLEVAKHDPRLSAVVLDIETSTGKAKSIEWLGLLPMPATD